MSMTVCSESQNQMLGNDQKYVVSSSFAGIMPVFMCNARRNLTPSAERPDCDQRPNVCALDGEELMTIPFGILRTFERLSKCVVFKYLFDHTW